MSEESFGVFSACRGEVGVVTLPWAIRHQVSVWGGFCHWWEVLWGYLVHVGRRRCSHSSMGGGVVGWVALILISCY